MGALEDWRETAAMPRGVDPGATAQPWAVARLISVSGTLARVSLYGSQPVDLPYVPGDYTDIRTVYVQLDPLRSGGGQLVLGPASGPVPGPPVGVVEPPDTLDAEALIPPIWTGTWSLSSSRYGAWKASRGDSTVLYQSSDFRGLAVYGDLVAGLGASSIQSMILEFPFLTEEHGQPQFRGSAQRTEPGPSEPPEASTGEVAVAAVGAEQIDLVESGLAERLRTGESRSLVMLGPDYVGVHGMAHPSGMTLRIKYRRPN